MLQKFVILREKNISDCAPIILRFMFYQLFTSPTRRLVRIDLRCCSITLFTESKKTVTKWVS